jgi:outer membrane protein assembly factor BamB
MKMVNILRVVTILCMLMSSNALWAQPRPQHAAAPEHLLRPRRVYRVSQWIKAGINSMDNLYATPTTLAAFVIEGERYAPKDVLVFDRKTGKQRWRKRTIQMAEQPAIGAISVEWSLLGTVARTGTDDVVVLRYLEIKNVANTVGETHLVFHAELQGRAARTGQVIWQMPISYDYRQYSNYVLVDDMVVLPMADSRSSDQWHEPLTDNAPPRPSKSGEPFTLVNAATGHLVGTHALQGRAFLNHLIARLGAHILLLNPETTRPAMIHLDTGLITSELEPLDVNSYFVISLIACSDDRYLVLMNHDNGNTGSSGWPRYLYCTDSAGKKVWTFEEGFEEGGIFSIEMLIRPGIVLVTTEYPNRLYCLRLADGKVLWQSRDEDVQPPLALYREGCFVLTANRRSPDNGVQGQPKSYSLAWVSARNGRWRHLGELLDAANSHFSGLQMGGSAHLEIIGDTLFVTDDLGTVREYSCADLLSDKKRGVTVHYIRGGGQR